MTYGTLIESIQATSAYVGFSNIPQTYDDLLVIVSARSENSGTEGDFRIRINGDNTSSNYPALQMRGSGSSTLATNTGMLAGYVNRTSSTSYTFTNVGFYIPNYTSNSTKQIFTEVAHENNATTAWLHFTVLGWSNTSAITSFETWAQTEAVDTFISLYGLKTGSGGATVS